MARNNRRAGHEYERQIRREYRELGFDECETSRYASRIQDDRKVDLCFTGEWNVQIKYTKQKPQIAKILNQMPDDDNINIIHWKKNKGSGGKKEEFVFMRKEDFYKKCLQKKQDS